MFIKEIILDVKVRYPTPAGEIVTDTSYTLRLELNTEDENPDLFYLMGEIRDHIGTFSQGPVVVSNIIENGNSIN